MIPSALEMFGKIAAEASGRRVAFFLDYDGTLTPIIDQPERAYMTEGMRKTVSTLAGLCPVAIVSGRDRAEVENFVQLDSIFYAGSHGFDIAGPGGSRMRQQGEQSVSLLREAEERARLELEGIQGAHVESKAFALFHVLHPRPVDTHGHGMLRLAGNRAGMAADAPAVVYDEPVSHERNRESRPRWGPAVWRGSGVDGGENPSPRSPLLNLIGAILGTGAAPGL